MLYTWLDKLIIFCFKLGGKIMLNGFKQAWEWKKDKRLYIGFGISTLLGLIWWIYSGMKWGIFVFIPPWILYLFILGTIRTNSDRQNEKKKKEYDYKFSMAGIKHKDGSYPMVIEHTEEYITLLTYIDIYTLEGYKNKLESVFNISIDKFNPTNDKQVIRLILKQKIDIPKILKWDDKYLKEDGIFNIGMDIKTGGLIQVNFNNYANCLIGGEPGGGKTKIMQLLAYQALKNRAKVVIGDFKGVDFLRFGNKCDVITDHNNLLKVLKEFRKEIDNRKELFIEVGAENLKDYNKITGKDLKRQYLIIDELGEAMEIIDINLSDKEIKELKSEIEKYMKSIARLGRFCGVNLIVGTQRPDVGILQGQTRDQFSGRICFKCVKQTSHIVLGNLEASLLGDEPGRAIVKNRTEFIEIQVFLFEKWMIKNLKNKKLQKEDLKVVGADENLQNNTNDKKDITTIDFDID